MRSANRMSLSHRANLQQRRERHTHTHNNNIIITNDIQPHTHTHMHTHADSLRIPRSFSHTPYLNLSFFHSRESTNKPMKTKTKTLQGAHTTIPVIESKVALTHTRTRSRSHTRLDAHTTKIPVIESKKIFRSSNRSHTTLQRQRRKIPLTEAKK